MTVGIRDLKSVKLPTAWDGNELSRLKLRDGKTFESLVSDLESGLNEFNSRINAGYLGRLVSVTNEPTVEYRSGGGNGFENETENTQPDSQFGDTSGHMLPLLKRDRGMKWTSLSLENMTTAKFDADVSNLLDDAASIYEKNVFTRLFKIEEETGNSFGLGASGVSVPFADGGAGSIAFTPAPRPDRMINAFSSAHNHYQVLNGITQANLETAVGHLWEHGVDGPYELIVSLSDLSSWQSTSNITGFKPLINSLIQYGGANDLALVENEIYFGAVETKYGVCRLYASGRIPTKYWAVTKTYGQSDQRNPLRVRYDDFSGGFGVSVVTENVSLYPFAGAIARFRFGVGVGASRVASVAVYNAASGNYATPTIA